MNAAVPHPDAPPLDEQAAFVRVLRWIATPRPDGPNRAMRVHALALLRANEPASAVVTEKR